MNLAEVTMNPIRQRIIQYLLIHGKGTVKEIKNALQDVPTPSLYRHMKILADNAIILVAEENRIRGTIESVYQLSPNALSIEDESGLAVQTALMSIATSFAEYFARDDADPKRDMLLLTSATLMLSDDEFHSFLAEVNEIAVKYMKKEPSEGCSSRQITLISSPGG